MLVMKVAEFGMLVRVGKGIDPGAPLLVAKRRISNDKSKVFNVSPSLNLGFARVLPAP